MKSRFYFRVAFPDGRVGTWCGGGLRKAKNPANVWLTRSDGSFFLEVPRKDVRPTNPTEILAQMEHERLLTTKASEDSKTPNGPVLVASPPGGLSDGERAAFTRHSYLSREGAEVIPLQSAGNSDRAVEKDQGGFSYPSRLPPGRHRFG
jgi:hypothetical protein